jgi:DNA-binding FadR family transcriptional regulator
LKRCARKSKRSAVAAFHERLADTIEARDPKAAGDVLGELLAYLRQSYATSLARRAERQPARAGRP